MSNGITSVVIHDEPKVFGNALSTFGVDVCGYLGSAALNQLSGLSDNIYYKATMNDLSDIVSDVTSYSYLGPMAPLVGLAAHELKYIYNSNLEVPVVKGKGEFYNPPGIPIGKFDPSLIFKTGKLGNQEGSEVYKGLSQGNPEAVYRGIPSDSGLSETFQRPFNYMPKVYGFAGKRRRRRRKNAL